MQIIKTIKQMHELSKTLRRKSQGIGFVPTMGALHKGHLSLVDQSKEDNDITVVSIFVNPIQFGPREDFKQYPRDEKGDVKKLEAIGTDVIFMPDSSDMFPQGFSTKVSVGSVGDILCGATRPGHFNGVATVVTKLFHIVHPDVAYFGQKDFQQSFIIKKLIKDLNFDIDIVICDTVREDNGLAMSSRNAYLDNREREAASILFRALKLGQRLIVKEGVNDSSSVISRVRELIASEPLARIEYIDIVDPNNCEKVARITYPVALCIAAMIGHTRLIDNMIVNN